MKLDRIMIIDADIDFAEELRYLFGTEGCEVTVLTSGKRAVEKALSERPDVILVELSSGPEGGISLARRLGSNEGTSRIPVVYLTEYYSVLSEHPDVRICFKSHFDPLRVVEELKSILEDI